MFIVTPIVGVCNCSMFCCTLLYVHSSIALILMGKRELVALLNLSSWCLVMVERLFLVVPWGCLRFVIMVPEIGAPPPPQEQSMDPALVFLMSCHCYLSLFLPHSVH